MTKKISLPELEEFQALLDISQISITASEAHGMLCGMISAKEHVIISEWILAICDDPELVPPFSTNEQQMLKQIAKITHSQLDSEDFEFQMMLPDDEQELQFRTQELAHWCHGYVAGLGISGAYINEHAESEASEALRDLAEISRLGGEIEGTEEEEVAFSELNEYVRVAVMMIIRALKFDVQETETQAELLH